MPDTLTTIATTTADGWLVVSRKMDMSRPLPPYRYTYSYTLESRLDDADQMVRDTIAGEYVGWEYVTIIPCFRGVPLGASVLP